MLWIPEASAATDSTTPSGKNSDFEGAKLGISDADAIVDVLLCALSAERLSDSLAAGLKTNREYFRAHQGKSDPKTGGPLGDSREQSHSTSADPWKMTVDWSRTEPMPPRNGDLPKGIVELSTGCEVDGGNVRSPSSVDPIRYDRRGLELATAYFQRRATTLSLPG